jgi:site-specific DNA-methyltransferase (adenine-specific)
VGERQVKGDSRSGQEPGGRPGGFGDVGADRGDGKPNGPLYGGATVPVYRCAPDCPVAELDRQGGMLRSGDLGGSVRHTDGGNGVTHGAMADVVGRSFGDSGGASRFYPTFKYAAKAPTSERPRLEDGTAHNTVKSLALIRHFARLITPPGGVILDMFAGSGPVGEAAIIEGFRCVLIEQDPKSVELIRTRLRKDIQPDLFGGAA